MLKALKTDIDKILHTTDDVYRKTRGLFTLFMATRKENEKYEDFSDRILKPAESFIKKNGSYEESIILQRLLEEFGPLICKDAGSKLNTLDAQGDKELPTNKSQIFQSAAYLAGYVMKLATCCEGTPQPRLTRHDTPLCKV